MSEVRGQFFTTEVTERTEVDRGKAKHPRGQNQAGWGTPTEATCADAIVPMWATQWTAQFDALLAKYSDTVVASFAGSLDYSDASNSTNWRIGLLFASIMHSPR